MLQFFVQLDMQEWAEYSALYANTIALTLNVYSGIRQHQNLLFYPLHEMKLSSSSDEDLSLSLEQKMWKFLFHPKINTRSNLSFLVCFEHE